MVGGVRIIAHDEHSIKVVQAERTGKRCLSESHAYLVIHLTVQLRPADIITIDDGH